MKRSIGYGAYGFGYADEPQWGIFNPPQSLYAVEPTLYNSLYATNKNLDESSHTGLTERRTSEHPDLPNDVGPRGAWKRNGRSQPGLGDFGMGSGLGFGTIAVIAIILFFIFKKN